MAEEYSKESLVELWTAFFKEHGYVPMLLDVAARYPEVRNWDVEFGSYFDENMVKSAAKDCVLGADVKTNLFEDEDPVGKRVRLKGLPFKIVGLLARKGANAFGSDQDDVVPRFP